MDEIQQWEDILYTDESKLSDQNKKEKMNAQIISKYMADVKDVFQNISSIDIA
jgi:hypothetical protein